MEKENVYVDAVKMLWSNSANITRQIDNSLGALHGIGLTEYMVLSSLVNAPNKVMRRVDLAEAVERTASGITRMLTPMEKIGLIAKEDNPRDARVSLVKITQAGEDIYSNATDTLAQRSEQILKRLNSDQIMSFLQLLKLVADER